MDILHYLNLKKPFLQKKTVFVPPITIHHASNQVSELSPPSVSTCLSSLYSSVFSLDRWFQDIVDLSMDVSRAAVTWPMMTAKHSVSAGPGSVPVCGGWGSLPGGRCLVSGSPPGSLPHWQVKGYFLVRQLQCEWVLLTLNQVGWPKFPPPRWPPLN